MKIKCFEKFITLHNKTSPQIVITNRFIFYRSYKINLSLILRKKNKLLFTMFLSNWNLPKSYFDFNEKYSLVNNIFQYFRFECTSILHRFRSSWFRLHFGSTKIQANPFMTLSLHLVNQWIRWTLLTTFWNKS